MFNVFFSYEMIVGDGIGGDVVYDFILFDEDFFGVFQELKCFDDLVQMIISMVKVLDFVEEYVENVFNIL